MDCVAATDLYVGRQRQPSARGGGMMLPPVVHYAARSRNVASASASKPSRTASKAAIALWMKASSAICCSDSGLWCPIRANQIAASLLQLNKWQSVVFKQDGHPEILSNRRWHFIS